MVNTYQENEYAMVYNGQIYNTKELKNTLEENGFKFDSYSDTEVFGIIRSKNYMLQGIILE